MIARPQIIDQDARLVFIPHSGKAREPLKTKAEQRIEQLINIGRPLTDEESDELYRALHADYMRKWRQHRAKAAQREIGRFVTEASREEERRLLARVRAEAKR